MQVTAFGDRSVSLVIRNYDQGDLLAFSAIRDAMLAAGVARSASIIDFLQTKRDTAE